MIIDTHCHLHFDAYDPDRKEVIERAKSYGIAAMITVGTDPATNEAAYNLTREYDCVYATAGLHPHHSSEVSDEAIAQTKAFVLDKKPVAIGEIGLDYFKSEAAPEVQRKAFIQMLRLTMETGLPAVIHSREAYQDTMDIIRSETGGKLKGVMHCFSYDKSRLKEVLDMGLLVSFTCNLTFKNAAALLEVAKFAPLDRMMLETDAPYLAPQIYRGKRNEPSCLVHLAQFLSEKRGVDQALLERTTTQTAIDFFKLKMPNG